MELIDAVHLGVSDENHVVSHPLGLMNRLLEVRMTASVKKENRDHIIYRTLSL
jgi:hypothetical protein